MDSVNTIGGAAWGSETTRPRSRGGFSDAWNDALASGGAAGASKGGVETDGQPSVRTSLLVALQDVGGSPSSATGTDDADASATWGNNAALLAKKAQEQAASDKIIDEIKEKGLANWAHEEWLKRIREKARQTALASMGLTEDDVAAMSPEMQARVEAMIKEVVEEAVRQATEKASGENGEKQQSNQAKVLSPIITGG